MKKILCIDGGGIRGIIPALVLAQIERQTGKPIAECFDLIAGTSTGGVIALGLCKADENKKPVYTANDLVEIYQNKGKEIFSCSLWRRIFTIWGLTNALYSNSGIEKVLEEYFGNDLLGSGITNTLIPCYDIKERQPFFLKSWKKEHSNVLMKHALRAAVAAPTYFEPALLWFNKTVNTLIDGSVFVNSPSVSAYVEAKRLFPDETDFFMLSLGTGKLTRPFYYEYARGWGKIEWVIPLLSCMFDGAADASDYQMRKLLGNQYIRLQCDLSIASDDIDNVTELNIQNLKNEAHTLILAHKPVINKVCQII